MKRTILYAICILLLVSLIGCASETTKTTTTNIQTATTLAQTATTLATNEVADAEQAINDIDAINQDLDTTDLANVSNEIDSINW